MTLTFDMVETVPKDKVGTSHLGGYQLGLKW